MALDVRCSIGWALQERVMRSTGNFSPEWGYLAPAPSILRTVRVVLVATAVGATAGAGVVLSLVDHSAGDGDRVAVAAHAIVTSAQADPIQAPVASAASAAPIAAAAPAISDAKIAPARVTTAVAAPAVQMPVQNSVPAAQQIQAAPQLQAAPQVAATPQSAPAIAAPAAVTAPAEQASAPPPANDSGAASAPAQPAVAALSDPAAPAVATSDANGDPGIVGPQLPQKKAKHHTANGRDFQLGSTLQRIFSARAGMSNYPNRAY
jgi:hypothetical protein